MAMARQSGVMGGLEEIGEGVGKVVDVFDCRAPRAR